MYKGNKKYTNGEITVYWYPQKCIHATTCYRELLEVFNPRKRPWVNMEGAPTEEIVRVVKMCPTRALDFRYNKDIEAAKEGPGQIPAGQIAETEEAVAEARVMKDGPLLLKGFRLIDEDGNEMKHQRIFSLCRCGQTRNPPFCDGMHRKTGFQGN